jgi:hypothetical protein
VARVAGIYRKEVQSGGSQKEKERFGIEEEESAL